MTPTPPAPSATTPPPRLARIARRVWPVVAIVALWALFFWRILTPTQADRLTFQQGDFTLQFLAYRQVAFAQIADGRFPAIEECLYSGHPFQADPQSQVLYPPVLATMLIGKALGWQTYPLRALEWEVMLHVLLAALGMVAFLRAARVRRLACVVGAVVYAFGGFLTGYAILQTAILETAAWLPLILLALRWLATARRWLPAAALLAGLVFFAFTAGHPQTLLFVVYAGVVAFVWWSRQSSLPGKEKLGAKIGRTLPRAVVAGALAIGLSAAQLLPTLSFMLASTRASLTFEQAGGGFVLHDLALFALTGVTNVWQPIYVGIAALALAVVALSTLAQRAKRGRHAPRIPIARAQDDTWLWVVLVVGALALSFGANAFGFDVAYLAVPGYRQFQSQERHAVIVVLALAVLAAYGAHALLQPLRVRALVRLRRNTCWLWMAGGLAFAAVVAVIVFGRATNNTGLGSLTDRLSVLALGLLGTAALFAWRVRLGQTPRWLWGTLVLGLLVFDLFTINRFAATQPVADPFPPLKLAVPIQQAAPSNQIRVYNHFGLPLNGACVRGLSEIGGGSPIVMRDYKTFLERVPEDVLVKLLNVRYAVTWRGAMETPDGKVIPWFLLARDTFEGKEASTYRLDWEPQNTTGAWIAKDVRTGSGDTMFDAMRADGFDPFATAFVASPTPQPLNGEGSAAIEGKATGYMKIAANASAPALLVVSEAYHWNWVARVNGVEAKPLVVDGALIGVPIPAGASSIELSYRPMDLYVGAGISALTLVVLVILLVADSRRSLNRAGASADVARVTVK